MKIRYIAYIIIFVQLVMFGCATATGPLFNEVPLAEYKGKAVVYFFRDSHTGSYWTFHLKINDEKPLPLQNKGYHVLILDPGTYNFAVFYDVKQIIVEKTFDLQADRAYYIRYRADILATSDTLYGPVIQKVGDSITSLPRDEALEVLKECRLIEVPGKP